MAIILREDPINEAQTRMARAITNYPAVIIGLIFESLTSNKIYKWRIKNN